MGVRHDQEFLPADPVVSQGECKVVADRMDSARHHDGVLVGSPARASRLEEADPVFNNPPPPRRTRLRVRRVFFFLLTQLITLLFLN